MEDFETLTKILRKDLMNKYRELFDNYSESNCDDEEYYEEYDNFYEDEAFEDDNYDEEVLEKLLDFIISSKYKNIFKLIIFNDVYEYIKTREISEIQLYKYELEILDKLENNDLIELLDKINYSKNFFLDLVTIFIEYNNDSFIEQEKYKNKKLLELSNNIDKLKKFKIYLFDDLQIQYKKTGKIF